MASINISIRKEVYQFLKTLKTQDKSFSDVILELKDSQTQKRGSKESIMKFFGALKDADIDWKAKEKRMKELRRSFNKELGERMK